jgi:hypothetical protein
MFFAGIRIFDFIENIGFVFACILYLFRCVPVVKQVVFDLGQGEVWQGEAVDGCLFDDGGFDDDFLGVHFGCF